MKPTNFKPMWDLKQSASSPDTLELFLYGEVNSHDYDANWNFVDAENSANHFREELAKNPNAKTINIFINSPGGSVYEGTAIYNQLKRHSAEKISYIDGFACSIASIIAMVGKVVMPKNTQMMIHNMACVAYGNAKELRKSADDLDIMSQANRQAYLQKCGDKLSEEKLIEMLDAETWLTAEQCIQYGFADEYAEKDADMTKASEMLQKMNLSMTQQIAINKSLATQLHEIVSQLNTDIVIAGVVETTLEIPTPSPETEPETPAQNINWFAALKR